MLYRTAVLIGVSPLYRSFRAGDVGRGRTYRNAFLPAVALPVVFSVLSNEISSDPRRPIVIPAGRDAAFGWPDIRLARRAEAEALFPVFGAVLDAL